MKHEYLIDLLKTNKTVIIPNIGAISNNENPEHKFLFNEYLKFNDGMIVKYISSKEGKTMDEAGDDLDKFTQSFSDLLSQGKEVVIPQIGALSKVDGKIILNCNLDNVTEKKVEPIIEKKPEPIITPKVEVPKPDPIIEKIPEPIVEKKIEPIVEKKVEPIIPPKLEVPKPEPIIEKKPEVIIPPKPEEPKTVTLSSDSVSKGEKQKEIKSKKKKKLVWIILLILLLGGGGTAGFIFKDKLMELVGMNETTASNDDKKEDSDSSEKEKVDDKISDEEIKEDVAVADSTLTESVEPEIVEEVIEEPVVEEKIEEVKAPIQVENSSPGNYYIIVGCYTNQSNADNMIAKISSAGLSPTNVGTFNSLIHIAAGSASDLSSASQQLNSVKSSFPSAWIMKR